MILDISCASEDSQMFELFLEAHLAHLEKLLFYFILFYLVIILFRKPRVLSFDFSFLRLPSDFISSSFCFSFFSFFYHHEQGERDLRKSQRRFLDSHVPSEYKVTCFFFLSQGAKERLRRDRAPQQSIFLYHFAH
jgi:hypothetical protein